MKICRLSFGVRSAKAKDFKWFYCPFLRAKGEKIFVWWFGHRWYVALGRRREQDG